MIYVAMALFGLLLALLAVLVAMSQRHRRIVPKLPGSPLRLAPHAHLRALHGSGRYRGVRIESNCRATSGLAGRVYGFDEAPDLPLDGCDARVCECGYAGVPERRQMTDRRSGADRRAESRAGTSDRRADRPRRQNDQSPMPVYGAP